MTRGGNAPENHRLLLVTGMSGAGRSTALKVLEDMGYEAVDNLPLSLLSRLMHSPTAADRPLAIGVDIRTRDFSAVAFLEEIDRLAAEPNLDCTLLFIDCEDEVLRRRYTETRRRHPLAADRHVADGILHERRLLESLRARADQVLDTSDFSPGDFRRIVQERFGLEPEAGLAVFVVSFSYRYGLPREADLVFDVRFLRNPHYMPALRPLSGRDAEVAAYVATDEDFDGFFKGLTAMLTSLLPRFSREGKAYLTIAVGCTGGRHRSVFVAERLDQWLRDEGHRVSLSHRDLERFEGKA